MRHFLGKPTPSNLGQRFVHAYSNWTEASLAVVAVWKGQANIVQAFVIGTVAINHLLLLGICFIHGGHHIRETSYPLLLASMHCRVIPFGIALSLGLSVFATDLGGRNLQSYAPHSTLTIDAGDVDIGSRNGHITAVLLSLLFVCHLVFLCQIHISYPLQARGLLRMVYPQDIKDGTKPLHRGMSRRITSAMAHRIQVQREEWLCERLLLPNASDSVGNNRKLWDSALTTAILLLSCGASLGSCFYLVNAISPTDVTSWKSPLHVGYLVAPSFTTSAGLSAMYLHGRWCSSGLDSGQVVCGAMTTTFRLLCFVVPASILFGWITNSGVDIMFLNNFQIAILGIAVLIPIYAIQAAGDDW